MVFKSALLTVTEISIGQKVLQNPRLYVLYWLSLNTGVEFNNAGELQDSQGRSTEALLRVLYLDCRQQSRLFMAEPDAPNLLPLSSKELRFALEELCDNQERSVAKSKAALGFAPEIDQIDRFLRDTLTVVPTGPEDEAEILSQTVYDCYKQWSATNKIKRPLSPVYLGRSLSSKGFRAEVRTVKGFSTRYRFLNQSSAIFLFKLKGR